MPRSDFEEDDGYDSVDEDAELELSCALHDLAERVKNFEENMKGRLKITGIGDDEDEEIGEDIPEDDDEEDVRDDQPAYGYASPKKADSKARPKSKFGAKYAKQQSDDSDEEDEYDDDDDEDVKTSARKTPAPNNGGQGSDWNEEHDQEELCELKHSIAMLLQGMKDEAKALEAAQTNQ
ncbi:hypothetical protein Poli38472_012692 [Pythium oligandrum]|uniref:Uncharacterized protein n=1 Tax=Pythium oligandrum TaxID=41045 RepID=A0A8K1FGC4_PYTOL|nr:hypothetical protein Poli38472_012692 [Pythium oligandrum]|eukprot:TMW61501.1 hypothetical protein Poli38472_012692 [Pythium oligandrum]